MMVLLDTCIIVDALTGRVPFAEDAQTLLRMGAKKDLLLFISAKSFLDIHYLLKHNFHDESRVRDIMASLLNVVTVVDVTGQNCVNALQCISSDYEDAVQSEAALDNGIDYIVTRDKPGFASSLVPSVTPKEIIEKI